MSQYGAMAIHDAIRNRTDVHGGVYTDAVAAVTKALLYNMGAPPTALQRGAWNDEVYGGDYTGEYTSLVPPCRHYSSAV
jgi:hypothetical protein